MYIYPHLAPRNAESVAPLHNSISQVPSLAPLLTPLFLTVTLSASLLQLSTSVWISLGDIAILIAISTSCALTAYSYRQLWPTGGWRDWTSLCDADALIICLSSRTCFLIFFPPVVSFRFIFTASNNMKLYLDISVRTLSLDFPL